MHQGARHTMDAGVAVIAGMTAVGSCRELPAGPETPGLGPPFTEEESVSGPLPHLPKPVPKGEGSCNPPSSFPQGFF